MQKWTLASSPEGFYEQQDPKQADMNLRGKFMTDSDGHFSFRSVKPAGYPIPIDGPVGDLVRATKRHNYRPAHLHFLIFKSGFKTLISQIYVNDDPRLDSDVQFGVTRALVGNYVRHDGPAPAADVRGDGIRSTSNPSSWSRGRAGCRGRRSSKYRVTAAASPIPPSEKGEGSPHRAVDLVARAVFLIGA